MMNKIFILKIYKNKIRHTIRITETELRNIITESVKKFIDEDMSSNHSAHTYGDYLNDNDFIEEEFRDKLIEYAKDMIMDFVDEEAVNNFDYKYGELYGNGYYNVLNI